MLYQFSEREVADIPYFPRHYFWPESTVPEKDYLLRIRSLVESENIITSWHNILIELDKITCPSK